LAYISKDGQIGYCQSDNHEVIPLL